MRTYSAIEAARVTGLSYRQVDHWDRLGLVRPSVHPAHGSGSHRSYSLDDVLRLGLAAELRLRFGLSLDLVAGFLAALPERDLSCARLQLVSGGATVQALAPSAPLPDGGPVLVVPFDAPDRAAILEARLDDPDGWLMRESSLAG